MKVSNIFKENGNEDKPLQDSPKYVHKETREVSFGFLILGALISLFTYIKLPKMEKVNGTLVIISLFLMLAAFSPQLVQNYFLREKATNIVVPEFLVITAFGVLLKIPSFRKNLGLALGRKIDVSLNYILVISIFVPLIAHIIWQWQCVFYNSPEAEENTRILRISAPTLTIITIIAFIWCITVGPIKK